MARGPDIDKVWTTPEGDWVSTQYLKDHAWGYGDASVMARELLKLRSDNELLLGQIQHLEMEARWHATARQLGDRVRDEAEQLAESVIRDCTILVVSPREHACYPAVLERIRSALTAARGQAKT